MTKRKNIDIDEVVATVERLRRRIDDRFPDSGLGGVCASVLTVSQAAKASCRKISAPIVWVRILVILLIGFIISSLVVLVVTYRSTTGEWLLEDLITTLEAGLNIVVFVGVVILFLVGIEARLKRRRALRAIHELRALAHIVDMHQLTKDPDHFGGEGFDTASSPARNLTSFQLNRYLDYSSEMLALIGKIAAIYAQHFDDAVAIAAVNEIETLTTGLSRKIWQKIVVLGRGEAPVRPLPSATPARESTEAPPAG